MATAPSETAGRHRQAIDVLLSYLEASNTWWPGADGLTIEDAIRSYPEAVAAGHVPNRGELLRAHPGLVDVLLDLLPAAADAPRGGR